MKQETEKEKVGLGITGWLGKRELRREPLTIDDWEEVYRCYLTFQHHLKLIVLQARARKQREANHAHEGDRNV